MFLIAFPLLLVPFALYNMLAFLLDVDLQALSVPRLLGNAAVGYRIF
jgi:hypothetical protein